MSIYALSDLHTDIPKNRQIIELISNENYTEDTLIVAGDISSDLSILKETLTLLKTKFKEVAFIPGNHDLWVSQNNSLNDSIYKLQAIFSILQNLSIIHKPCVIEDVWIIPLYSWFDDSLADTNMEGNNTFMSGDDLGRCVFPIAVHPSEYFDDLNNQFSKEYELPIISFSHFIPRRELLHEFKELSNYAGSALIEKRISNLSSKVHICGHLHLNQELLLEEVIYIQNTLGYPEERKLDYTLRLTPINLIFKS